MGREAMTWLAVQGPTRDAAYDVVLLAHVLSVVAAFGSVAVSGGSAVALARRRALPESIVRYYRPGTNWAGRVLFVVPVLGFVLLGLSRGAYGFDDHWVVVGLVLWVVAASLAEMVLWPAERGLQEIVARAAADAAGAASPPPPLEDRPLGPLCRRTALAAAGIAILLVAASVVMVAKP